KISSKCGIFAEADANTLVKGGVPVEEIIASLFEAVVQQNLSTLTKGNTPAPEVLLLGGPNLFFKGLQEAWRHHLKAIWADRQVVLPDKDLNSLIRVPSDAVYYASLGCVEIGKTEGQGPIYQGTARLRWWIEEGQHELKAKEGGKSLISSDADLDRFLEKYGDPERGHHHPARSMKPRADWNRPRPDESVLIGCDFGSTTAKAVVISADATLRFRCYAPSKGNPIEDAKDLLRQIREAGFLTIGALALTGYGKDLLKDI